MRLGDFGLDSHPLRAALASEMHVRKLPPLRAPTRIMQVIALSDAGAVDGERRRVAGLLGRDHLFEGDANFMFGDWAGFRVVWERHTEFTSHMFISEAPFDDPFEASAFSPARNSWFRPGCGTVLRATLLSLADAAMVERAGSYFSAEDLVVCEVADGAARLWSDFRIHDDGFGRLLLLDNGLTPLEASLVVQRLQELGNYRNMALLGLPVAQRLAPQISEYEQRLGALSKSIANEELPDENLLEHLLGLSAELASVIAETRYRMSASRAYSQITHDRLASLRVGRVAGYPTLGDFTDRRLLPAVRTCISFSNRLDDLSQRLEWTNSLMRTRVDTALSVQHRDLLKSMDRRTDLQLRLQQTVEGLSAVAISYYFVGLVSYVAKGLHLGGVGHETITAAVVPIALAVTALGLRRFKFRHASF